MMPCRCFQTAIKTIAAFLVLGLAGDRVCSEGPANAENPVQVVLLGGQSNMAGAGDFHAIESSLMDRIEKVSPRVQVGFNGKPPRPLSNAASPRKDGKYGIKDAFGPEMFVGLTLAEHDPDRDYLLIKTSRGGTSLYGAWNPHWSARQSKAVEKGESKQNAKLHSDHLDQIRQELQRLTKQGKRYEVIGMMWMQGENDAAREVSARSYQSNLIKLIASYRNQLKAAGMPFVIGQINSSYGDFPDGPAMVREAMATVAASDANVAILETTMDRSWPDYPKHSDNVHYNTEGQVRLGNAMAQALIQLRTTSLIESGR